MSSYSFYASKSTDTSLWYYLSKSKTYFMIKSHLKSTVTSKHYSSTCNWLLPASANQTHPVTFPQQVLFPSCPWKGDTWIGLRRWVKPSGPVKVGAKTRAWADVQLLRANSPQLIYFHWCNGKNRAPSLRSAPGPWHWAPRGTHHCAKYFRTRNDESWVCMSRRK